MTPVSTQTAFSQLEQANGTASFFPRFSEYHQKNPHVFDWFERFTFEVINAGKKKYGAHAVIQRIRWEHNITVQKTDEFKISNGHFPFYARLFMLKHPQFTGFFRTKTLH